MPSLVYTMFTAPRCWTQSRRRPANVYRDWFGIRIVIFRQDDGFKWFIAEDYEGETYKRFSPSVYATQDDAIHAASESMDIPYERIQCCKDRRAEPKY